MATSLQNKYETHISFDVCSFFFLVTGALIYWHCLYHNIGISTTMYNIIIRNNGLNGFYKGFYFPLITNGTINALVYGVYGSVLR